jgi:hypothetical protein
VSVPEPPRPPSPPQSPTATLGGTSDAPKRPWWQRGWAVASIGVLGLLVGAGIGASGKSSTKTVTNEGTTTTVQVAQTAPRTVTHIVVHNHTHTVTQAAPAEPSEPSSAEASEGGGHSYSGDGIKSLGTLTVSQPSTLHWHTSGASFTMTGATSGYDHTIAVSSKASSGESAVEPGTYREVEVIGDGEWSLTIDPG